MSQPDWADVERALATALDLPEQERAVFLIGLPYAIRTEVESLLDAHGRADGFLSVPKAVGREGSLELSRIRLQADAIRAGDILAGRYEILSKLGAGGMSSVYRARDRLIGEIIALKVIHPSVAVEPKLYEKFKQELSIGRRLAHPNVVRIHDIGEADGVLFISMEWVDGRTLAEIIAEQGPLPLAEFWKVFQALCDALACVHSKGIIHRDVKALNVMIDRSGVLKLMDFGVARDTTSEFTMGMAAGTPAYMAPEMLLDQASPASDIYAAGVVFCELLTGSKPKNLKLPAEVPGLSPELKAVIERCLRGDPRMRYQSVRELVDAAAGAVLPVSGRTLADYLETGPADRATLLPILARIVDAVTAPHGPLAPRTIWLLENGETKVETAIAQAKYSAPDMFQETGSSGEAIDVYVLGFILYELLAGRQIFAAQIGGEWNPDDEAWRRWHLDSGRRLRPLAEIVPGFPAALSKLVEQMVEKDPGSRGVSLTEVSRALHDMADETQVESPVNAPAEEVRGKHTMRFWTLLLAGMLLLAAVLAVVYIRDRSPQAEHLPQIVATGTGDMVLIPAGKFLMGNDRGRKSRYGYENEAPAHRVSLPPFYMDKYEVTNALYKRFCDATGRARPLNPTWDEHYFEKAGYPVVNVSWSDARAYAAWARKRLPSDEEWEKAARGTDGRLFPWGDEFHAGDAKTDGKLPSPLAPVGSFPSDRSPYGVMDMAGNAPEWVESDYRLYPGNAFGPLPPDEMGHKVVRGNGVLGAGHARITERGSQAPQLDPQRHSLIGFRCAADVRAVQEILRQQATF